MTIKKKKIVVPLPDDLNNDNDTKKNFSFDVIHKMDKDIQTRIVCAALKLDVNWLIKIFAIGCEEMYLRASLKELQYHPDKIKFKILKELKLYGYIINKNI